MHEIGANNDKTINRFIGYQTFERIVQLYLGYGFNSGSTHVFIRLIQGVHSAIGLQFNIADVFLAHHAATKQAIVECFFHLFAFVRLGQDSPSMQTI